MTGFGRGEASLDEQKITIEIKSVNNRFCDIQIRQPRLLAALESRIREATGKCLSRGKIDLFINYEDKRTDSIKVLADINLAEAYVTAFREIADSTSIPEGLNAALIGRMNDVMHVESARIDEESVWQLLDLALNQALANLLSMRRQEGQKLVDDILLKLEQLEKMLEQIALRAPTVPVEYRAKLKQRLQDLLEDQAGAFFDEQRMAAEIAVFADKCAIDEELVRLGSHFVQMKQMLEETEPIGKKLDFLMQEINREVNTIGSKANDLQLTRLVVNMKSELEKIREQVQNLE
jgi:uncharacterized protein (TIGR00255 family)